LSCWSGLSIISRGVRVVSWCGALRRWKRCEKVGSGGRRGFKVQMKCFVLVSLWRGKCQWGPPVDCAMRNEVVISALHRSYVQITSKPHTLRASFSGCDLFLRCATKWFYFSRDNALSNVSNLEVNCDKRLSEGDGDDDRAIFNNGAHLGPSGGWRVVQLSNIVLPREAWGDYEVPLYREVIVVSG